MAYGLILGVKTCDDVMMITLLLMFFSFILFCPLCSMVRFAGFTPRITLAYSCLCVHPSLSLSFSTVRRQVVLGLYLVFLSSGFHPRATVRFGLHYFPQERVQSSTITGCCFSLPRLLIYICPLQPLLVRHALLPSGAEDSSKALAWSGRCQAPLPFLLSSSMFQKHVLAS